MVSVISVVALNCILNLLHFNLFLTNKWIHWTQTADMCMIFVLNRKFNISARTIGLYSLLFLFVVDQKSKMTTIAGQTQHRTIWGKYLTIILIWNYWTIWKQTWIECFLVGPPQHGEEMTLMNCVTLIYGGFHMFPLPMLSMYQCVL